MKFNASKVSYVINSHNKLCLTFECESTADGMRTFDSLKELDKIEVEAKKFRQHRSMNANAYMWVLLDKMAKALQNGETKDSLYRKYIRDYGVFNFINVPDNAVETFIRGWIHNGLGWYAEVVRDSINKGSKVLIVYTGSSEYNTEQMSDLINAIVSDAKDMGIETKTPLEIADMMSLWKQGEQG